MKRWILKKLGVLGGCNMAELQILDSIINMNIAESQKDLITDIVKAAIDKNIRGC